MVNREDLPQIPRALIPKFGKFCKSKGIPVKVRHLPIRSLKPVQRHLNTEKVKTLMGQKINSPLLVSQEGYIIDGHHRWAAEAMKNKDGKVICVQFGCPIDKMVELGHDFDGSTTKTIDESQKRKKSL